MTSAGAGAGAEDSAVQVLKLPTRLDDADEMHVCLTRVAVANVAAANEKLERAMSLVGLKGGLDESQCGRGEVPDLI